MSVLSELLEGRSEEDQSLILRWAAGESTAKIAKGLKKSSRRLATYLCLHESGTLDYYQAHLDALAPHLEIQSVEYKGTNLYAHVLDTHKGTEFETRIGQLITNLKPVENVASRPDIQQKIEETYTAGYYQEKIEALAPGRYQVIRKIEDSELKARHVIEVKDLVRNVVFQYDAVSMVRLLRESPERLFSLSEEEKSKVQYDIMVEAGVVHDVKVRDASKSVSESSGRSRAYVASVLRKMGVEEGLLIRLLDTPRAVAQ